MRKDEKNNILSHIAYMSDNVLKEKTHDAIYDCLGSDIDKMIEFGYSVKDIEERRKYEKFLSEKADLYTRTCEARGIKLF